MDQRHLQEMAHLEDTYWWHVAKRDLVVELLKKHAPTAGIVVEGGIGSGRNLLEFQRLGFDVHGYDLLDASIEMAKQRGLEHVRRQDLHDAWPLEDGSVSAVVMLDVLEHMAEPVPVLEHAARVLKPDGVVILTVPAYPMLFGKWDEILGHHRRYTKRTLRRHAEQAGLDLAWCQHWNSFTLPAAMGMRLKERIRPQRDAAEFPRVPKWVNSLLLRCAGLERSLLLRIGMPCGLSIAGVLQHADRERQPISSVASKSRPNTAVGRAAGV
ncbi:class I SAM-dependent methyltransferase [Thalassoroseus pseudoceratinae]|uniref:class I SAM-dependent methyltransferase n=1 Tax=Thalassoroseus pseudoceratinae TaxID=2713176 RepID=UPI00141DB2F8|nr:class I SAM-dependent methyltransferase [Thalassoroseus pseudoceratinae]